VEDVGVGGEEVGPRGKYREEEALSDAVAKQRSDTSTGGGYSLDEGKGGLGQRKPVPEVVG